MHKLKISTLLVCVAIVFGVYWSMSADKSNAQSGGTLTVPPGDMSTHALVEGTNYLDESFSCGPGTAREDCGAGRAGTLNIRLPIVLPPSYNSYQIRISSSITPAARIYVRNTTAVMFVDSTGAQSNYIDITPGTDNVITLAMNGQTSGTIQLLWTKTDAYSDSADVYFYINTVIGDPNVCGGNMSTAEFDDNYFFNDQGDLTVTVRGCAVRTGNHPYINVRLGNKDGSAYSYDCDGSGDTDVGMFQYAQLNLTDAEIAADGKFVKDVSIPLNKNNECHIEAMQNSPNAVIKAMISHWNMSYILDYKEYTLGDFSAAKPTDSFKGCDGISDSGEKERCQACLLVDPANPDSEPTGAIWTELGWVDPSPAGLITRLFQIGLGIMGGIAVIRFIQIALVYQSGDQQKIQDARNMIISLIGGVIFLIAAIVILRFIGINVLGLPDGFLD